MFHYTIGWRYGCADWDLRTVLTPVAGTMVRCKQIDRFNCAALCAPCLQTSEETMIIVEKSCTSQSVAERKLANVSSCTNRLQKPMMWYRVVSSYQYIFIQIMWTHAEESHGYDILCYDVIYIADDRVKDHAASLVASLLAINTYYVN